MCCVCCVCVCVVCVCVCVYVCGVCVGGGGTLMHVRVVHIMLQKFNGEQKTGRDCGGRQRT